MSDFSSGLPIRSQLPSQANYDDVVMKLADATVSTQLASVDTFGSQSTLIKDATGTAVTAQVNGAQYALDVGINVAGVQIDPRQIRALTSADVVTVDQGTSPWVTSVNNFPATVDTNYGVVGASTIRTASQIGNATGAADFNFGAAGAQTLRVASLVGNATGAADFNYGAVGAQTVRTASQIGNATGAADFNNGATGTQTLRVAANLAVGGADVTASNPVPVTISVNNAGTEINNYNTASAVAAGATSNHDYTVTALKTLLLTQIEASASGKMKTEVQIETGVATGVFNTRFVQFSSTATASLSIHLAAPISVAAGVRVRVIRTNKDNQAQDLYSTISGQEVP